MTCTCQRPVKADPNQSCGGSTGHQILENQNRTIPESLELQLQVQLQPVAVWSSCSFLQFMQLDFQTLRYTLRTYVQKESRPNGDDSDSKDEGAVEGDVVMGHVILAWKHSMFLC